MGRLISQESKSNFILYGSEDLALLRLAEAEYITENSEVEIERFEQSDLDVAELFASLGSVSFFAEKRVVILRFDDITKVNDDDFESVCSAVQDCEECRVAIFLYYGDKYSAEGKKAKALQQMFSRLGSYKPLLRLNGDRLKKHIQSSAKSLGCTIDIDAVELLVNKFSNDIILLENEISKAAAISDYQNISRTNVETISTTVLSADIFSLVTLMVAGDKRQCFSRLAILLEQGHEPIAVLAAITGSFVDVYRVGTGLSAGKKYSTVFKDFGYKGSDYRLKKASEVAAKISGRKISQIIKLLLQADLKLKSTAADRDIVLYRYLLDVSRLARA